MKKTLLSILAAMLMVSCCCDCKKDANIEAVMRGIDRAHHQLALAAAEFDTLKGFPRSTMPKFKEIDPQDWTSGFFPGSLWQIYNLTGDEKMKEEALKYTARLDGIQFYTGTHDLGFMVFCSYGQQQAALKDEVSAKAIVDASNSLSTRFRPEIGTIRSWDFGEWNYPVIIDNMMNLEMLFWASKHTGDTKYRDLAICHADTTLKNHFRDNYSSYHVVSYNNDGTVESQGTFQGHADDSSWARGQAWGLYGYTMCYRECGEERYLEQAKRIANLVMNELQTPEDLIPWWDYNAPDIPDAPRDASAAAVIASALFELSTMVPDMQKEYFDYAERILMSLSSDAYLAPEGENGNFVLMHCVGHHPANSEIDVPLNYADYYYLEAITRYLKLRGVDPLKC